MNRTRITSAQSIFCLEYQPSSGNITRCQVPLRIRAWFHDAADDIDFYQMSLSQSESTILHERLIYNYTYYTLYIYTIFRMSRDFRPTRELFIHMETSPLPVKGFKF